jgi:hypothetical protein
VTHYHHPHLLEALDGMSPEMRLLELIDAEIFGDSGRDQWRGTAFDLESELKHEDSRCRYEARQLLTWGNAVGTYLGRLMKKHPRRFSYDRSNHSREWVIKHPNA